MRVTQYTLYRLTTRYLERFNETLASLNLQVASGKRVNYPSEDPVAALSASYAHQRLAEISQYSDTVNHARHWLEAASGAFESINSILNDARSLANQIATGTMDDHQRSALASRVQGFIDQLVSLANTDVEGSYIFSGTRTTTKAALATPAAINPATASGANTGTGQVWGMGSYTGLLSRSVRVTIDQVSGGVPTRISYSYVDDYGRTISGWRSVGGLGEANAVDVGDNIKIYFTEGGFAAGDSYTLTIGRYQGNTQQLQANLSWANRMPYNYTLEELFGPEGNTGSGWESILDLLAQWKEALEKDFTEQESYEPIPGIFNRPSTTLEPTASNTSWEAMRRRQLELQVGGPLQFRANVSDSAIQAAQYQFYLEDPSYSGVPSDSNPMVLRFRWWDSSTSSWVYSPTRITITGTGPDNAVTFTNTVGTTTHEISVWVMNSSYDTSLFPDWNGGAPTTSGYEFTFYNEATAPSTSNPVTFTYAYTGDDGLRHHASVSFTGTGSAYAQTLNLGSDQVTITLSEGGVTDDGDFWDFRLTNYHQAQTISQQLTERLEQFSKRLLKYSADAGGKLNRLEVRKNLLDSDTLRLAGRLTEVQDADIPEVVSNLSLTQILYQAALQATAIVTSRTLADYL